jgi:OOP family OmpA-OmpF porin
MKKVVLILCFCLLFIIQADAQGFLNRLGNSVKEAVENTVERKAVQKAEEVTESVLEGKNTQNESESAAEIESEIDSDIYNVSEGNSNKVTQQKLTSTSKYDFVPGDQIIYFDDFSQDAIGDFPALWTSNGSGEVKTVNIAPGNWFHLNGEDAVYCYTKEIELPDNFIVEFDIIPDEEYRYGIQFTLYNENPNEAKELNNALFPGIGGLHIVPGLQRWRGLG